MGLLSGNSYYIQIIFAILGIFEYACHAHLWHVAQNDGPMADNEKITKIGAAYYVKAVDASFLHFHGTLKGTSRQRSGKGAIKKRFPLQKPRWKKTN